LAIKGKGRTRGRRAVAAPPKRAIVVRKPPIWRRRWVWLVVGLLAVAGIVAGVLAALHAHDVSTRKDREERAVRSYLNLFRDHLPADRTPVPPDVIVLFSSLQDSLSKIGNGLSATEAEQKGKDVAAMAKRSADRLQGVSIPKLIPAGFAGDRAELTEAQFLIVQSYRLYEQIGGLIQAAATASGKEQTAIVDQVQLLMNRSGTLFDRGYAKIVRMANRLDIPVETAYAPPPQAPQAPPSPTPSAATPTPTASPSASPSA
jgi:hypothetical protein